MKWIWIALIAIAVIVTAYFLFFKKEEDKGVKETAPEAKPSSTATDVVTEDKGLNIFSILQFLGGVGTAGQENLAK